MFDDEDDYDDNIWLKVLLIVYSQKSRHPKRLHFPFSFLTRNVLKVVKPSPGRKMIELLAFDIFIPSIFAKNCCGRMAKAIAFSRQNDTGLRARSI